MKNTRYDVVIVGARVAGAATALVLASAGARVLIVDRSPDIGDTLSTHALMRPAVELLGRWGLLGTIVRAGTPWVRQAEFVYGHESMTIPVRPSPLAEGLIAPRRWLLDSALLNAAVAAGAEIALGTTFETCLQATDGRVLAVGLRRGDGSRWTVEAGLLVGADGRQSRVAATVGARTIATSPDRTATVYTYIPGIPNEGYRWCFARGVTASVIPTTGGESCIVAACRPDEFRSRFAGDTGSGVAAIVAEFDPALADRVRSAGDARWRRFPGAPGVLRARVGPGWALVGDAAFYRDPATAHGITDAFLDAQALGTALIAGRPSDYHAERTAQAAQILEVTRRIASLDWTLDDVRVLHERLNACMKAEAAALAAGQMRVEPTAGGRGGDAVARAGQSQRSENRHPPEPLHAIP